MKRALVIEDLGEGVCGPQSLSVDDLRIVAGGQQCTDGPKCKTAPTYDNQHGVCAVDTVCETA